MILSIKESDSIQLPISERLVGSSIPSPRYASWNQEILANITTKKLISNKVLTKKMITIFAFNYIEKENDYDRKSI